MVERQQKIKRNKGSLVAFTFILFVLSVLSFVPSSCDVFDFDKAGRHNILEVHSADQDVERGGLPDSPATNGQSEEIYLEASWHFSSSGPPFLVSIQIPVTNM